MFVVTRACQINLVYRFIVKASTHQTRIVEWKKL